MGSVFEWSWYFAKGVRTDNRSRMWAGLMDASYPNYTESGTICEIA